MTTSAPKTRPYITAAFIQQLIDLRPTGNQFLTLVGSSGCPFTGPRYYREFRTVSVNSHRQTGKSTAIREMADEQSWIFAVNLAKRDVVKEELIKLGKTVAAERVFTSGDMKNFTFAFGDKDHGVLDKDIETFGKPKRIFVDEASYFFERFSQHEFYKQLAPRLLPETDFVLVG